FEGVHPGGEPSGDLEALARCAWSNSSASAVRALTDSSPAVTVAETVADGDAEANVWQAIVAVIGLVGSAAGAIWAAYVGTRRRVLAELEGRYDAALRDLRLGVYPQLWAALQPLAKYAREPPGLPEVKEIEALSTRLRLWYFEE